MAAFCGLRRTGGEDQWRQVLKHLVSARLIARPARGCVTTGDASFGPGAVA